MEPLRTLHLFAGAGGGLLADIILGHVPVAAVEIDHYCCEVLRSRATEGWFPGLQVFEQDCRVFDPSPWKGRVDCISAGWPCQDISCAGKRVGIKGERSGLFSEIVRIAGEIRPSYVFLENSPNIVNLGIGEVLGQMADLGYDARWCVLPASAVGAPHVRARWWCLCELPDTNHDRQQKQSVSAQWRQDVADVGGSSEGNVGAFELSNTDQERRFGWPGEFRQGWWKEFEDSGSLGYSVTSRLEKHKQEQTEEQPPAVGTGWWDVDPANQEGATESGLGRVVDGLAHRVDRAKAVGNGQVPLQAALAWLLLEKAKYERR